MQKKYVGPPNSRHGLHAFPGLFADTSEYIRLLLFIFFLFFSSIFVGSSGGLS